MVTPEQFWIDRGEEVMGREAIAEGENTRQAATYQAIVDGVRDCASVLDVGCNVAALGHFLRRAGYKGAYTGVDTNAHALRLAEAAGFAVMECDARNIPLSDGYVEAVAIKDLLEHLEDYKEVFGEALRLASRCVVVATYVQWQDGPTELVQLPMGYYMNRYSRKTIYAFAKKRGFSVKEVLQTPERNGTPNEVIIFERNA